MTRIEQPHHSIRWRRGEPSIEWGNAQSPRRSLELRRAARVRPRGRRQRTVLCHTSHARDAFHIVHHHPPSSSLAGFPVWPRPTVPRAVAPAAGVRGGGPSHQSRDRSVPAPRTVRLVHLPAFLAAVLIIQQVFILTQCAARPRAPRRRAKDEHPVHGWGWGTGASPRAVGTAPDRPHALWCLRPLPHEPHLGGRRSWTACWGAGAQHVPCRAGPRRTIVTGWWCGWPVPRNRLSGGARHADTRVVDERASLRRTIL
jgi:hypothetical protein